ncbi:N-acetyltransferase [Actinomadura rubrisoli]|uniref:N-acetyltransferase n=1 Tax=Actinomadura rubrisoli TaxID=2530368 RepID=A0A4R5C0M6_9ACTN|nr:N-acetyltransferase [Actinomadura rubrisoli]
MTWRRVDENDFPLLAQWLSRPHVARWWNHDPSAEAVLRGFGPAARGEEPSEDLLASVDGRPFGLVQCCFLSDYPDYAAELATLADVPAGAMTIDYPIGDPDRTGHGLGTRMIESVLHRIWTVHPSATCVIVPVVAANRNSWRALERAGLRKTAEGDLEPDNPIDDPTHHLYRTDRP